MLNHGETEPDPLKQAIQFRQADRHLAEFAQHGDLSFQKLVKGDQGRAVGSLQAFIFATQGSQAGGVYQEGITGLPIGWGTDPQGPTQGSLFRHQDLDLVGQEGRQAIRLVAIQDRGAGHQRQAGHILLVINLPLAAKAEGVGFFANPVDHMNPARIAAIVFTKGPGMAQGQAVRIVIIRPDADQNVFRIKMVISGAVVDLNDQLIPTRGMRISGWVKVVSQIARRWLVRPFKGAWQSIRGHLASVVRPFAANINDSPFAQLNPMINRPH